MEVRSQELREGNLVQSDEFSIGLGIYSDGAVQVTAYGIHLRKEGRMKDWKYLPITAERLLQLGFKQTFNTKTLTAFKKGDSIIYIGKIIEYYFRDYEYEGKAYTRLREIKYVHQLQNLYFALTGEELIIQGK